ncbi:peptidase inhibitor family I36 protein [Streptomyces sp. B1866]|uniref:peptidase inhibitor family I36 protein n=1 Tax=Streptomyces sp. B1866 TaxID=3075431 RepID=UPI002891A01D|nr:peptidase inhibitor family I36 protein [Streptomyces sp. B1866]MDT3395944.1 peptidase inhibitor family I36 protein [Streptomyces sp. B1866]
MKKRLLALVGAAAIAAGLPLTAQAASTDTRCPQGDVCGWPRPNFGGPVEILHNPEPGCDSLNARSVSNQSRHRITLYSDYSCRGQHFDLTHGHYSASTPWTVKSVAIWG